MSTLLIKQLITSFFIMPRGSRAYTVRVRHHRRRPPGSFRRRHVAARYPGGHILNRDDLASYVPLLRQNGLIPGPGPGPEPVPGVDLETVVVSIPEISNKTFTSSTYNFVISPVPEGVLAWGLSMLRLGGMTVAWQNHSSSQGSVTFLSGTTSCCSVQFARSSSTGEGSLSGNLYVWQDGPNVCCGFVSAVSASGFYSLAYVQAQGSLSALGSLTVSLGVSGLSMTDGDASAVYTCVVLDE
jgi:hypothetical protein